VAAVSKRSGSILTMRFIRPGVLKTTKQTTCKAISQHGRTERAESIYWTFIGLKWRHVTVKVGWRSRNCYGHNLHFHVAPAVPHSNAVAPKEWSRFTEFPLAHNDVLVAWKPWVFLRRSRTLRADCHSDSAFFKWHIFDQKLTSMTICTLITK